MKRFKTTTKILLAVWGVLLIVGPIGVIMANEMCTVMLPWRVTITGESKDYMLPDGEFDSIMIAQDGVTFDRDYTSRIKIRYRPETHGTIAMPEGLDSLLDVRVADRCLLLRWHRGRSLQQMIDSLNDDIWAPNEMLSIHGNVVVTVPNRVKYVSADMGVSIDALSTDSLTLETSSNVLLSQCDVRNLSVISYNTVFMSLENSQIGNLSATGMIEHIEVVADSASAVGDVNVNSRYDGYVTMKMRGDIGPMTLVPFEGSTPYFAISTEEPISVTRL